MAAVTKPTTVGNAVVFTGGAGVNANDVIFGPLEVSRFDDFQLMSTAGAMQVLASLDGVNFGTAPLTLIDEGAAAVGVTYVIVTAANRMYRLQGTWAQIKVTQNGATGVANASLTCSKKGGQY
jgi:hypothetical protein